MIIKKETRNKARETNGSMPKATEMNMMSGAAKTNKLVFFRDSIVMNCSCRQEGQVKLSPSVNNRQTVCPHVHVVPQFWHFGIAVLPFPCTIYTYVHKWDKFPKPSHYFSFLDILSSYLQKSTAHCEQCRIFLIGILFRYPSCCAPYQSGAPCFRSVHASALKTAAKKASPQAFHMAHRP